MTTLAPSLNQGSIQPHNPQFAAWARNHKREAARLITIESALATLSAGTKAAHIATQASRADIDDATSKVAWLRADARERGEKPDAEQLADAEAVVARAIEANEARFAAAATAVGLDSDTNAARNSAVQLANALAASGDRVTPVDVPVKGSAIEVIKKERALQRSLNGEEKEVSNALPDKEEFREAAHYSMHQLADSGAFKLAKDASIRFKQEVLPVTPTVGSSVLTINDSGALIAFLLRDKLIEHVDAEVEARYAGGALALNPMERRERLADIAERRLASERIEVEAVFAAWAEGIPVGLRKDTNAKALLGIA